MKFRIPAFSAFLTVTAMMAFGQQQNTELNRQLNVVRPYEPSMGQAPKMNFNPSAVDDITIEAEFDYAVSPLPVVRAFGVQPLSPYFAPLPGSASLSPGYVNLGLGVPLRSVADVYYGSTRNEKQIWGVQAHHRGQFSKVKYDQGEKMAANRTVNDLGVYWTGRWNDRFTTELNARYDYDLVSWISENPYLKLVNTSSGGGYLYNYRNLNGGDSRTQHLNRMHVNAAAGTPFTDLSYFNYRLGLTFDYVTDRFKARENTGKVELRLGSNLASTGNGLFLDTDLRWAGRNDHFFAYHAANTQIQTFKKDLIFDFTPYYRFGGDKLTVMLGATFAYDLENDRSRIYPMAQLEYAFAQGRFRPYLSIDGTYRMNTYNELSRINPYLLSGIYTPNNSVRRYTVGMKGDIASLVNYHIYGEIRNAGHEPLFVNSCYRYLLPDDLTGALTVPGYGAPYYRTAGYNFVTYTDKTTTKSFGAELLVDLSEKVQAYASVRYNHYNTDTLTRAYGKPQWENQLQIRYSLTPKWAVRLDLNHLGKRYFAMEEYRTGNYPTWLGPTHKQKSFTQLGIGIDYGFTDKLAFWLRGDNLTNSKRYLYNNNPEVGINFSVGATFSF